LTLDPIKLLALAVLVQSGFFDLIILLLLPDLLSLELITD
jgi:hypothetical protein